MRKANMYPSVPRTPHDGDLYPVGPHIPDPGGSAYPTGGDIIDGGDFLICGG